MSGFQAFDLGEVETRHRTASGPYLEFLRRPGFSMGMYVIRRDGTDNQHPHQADEVYVVLQGAGTLRVEGEDTPVTQGSVVSVDRGREHSFVGVKEDLQILVVFAPPEEPEA